MARQNKRGLELSFKRLKKGESRGRWFKTIDGEAEYFGFGNGVSDRESYQAALIKYRAFVKQQSDVARAMTKSFLSIEAIQSACFAAFGKSAEGVFGGTLHRELRQLESIRNLYAHRGGVVDRQFLDDNADIPRIAALPLGTPFPFVGEFCAEMLNAAVTIGDALIRFVDDYLSRNASD